ncbi:transmembrane protein 254 isoform X2 [Dendropsophus ebraccatus]|uniref:transmembrane protein 254 isoform X2 n=1 Tax=Dendropsophus ebraccatus TaxID=150705 RepID=UPI003831E693
MASAGSASYFQRTGILWMALISLSMGFFTWTVFWPTQVPYEQLGPLGSLAQYMVKNHYSLLYYGAKGITDSGARMQWLIQTALFGIASLSLLLSYKPGKKRR